MNTALPEPAGDRVLSRRWSSVDAYISIIEMLSCKCSKSVSWFYGKCPDRATSQTSTLAGLFLLYPHKEDRRWKWGGLCYLTLDVIDRRCASQPFSLPQPAVIGNHHWWATSPKSQSYFLQMRRLLALAFPLRRRNSSSVCCSWAGRWWVALNCATCSTHTALSTRNKKKGRQMTLLSLIAGTSTTAHPTPSTDNMPGGFFSFLCLNKGDASCMQNVENQKTVVRTPWITL